MMGDSLLVAPIFNPEGKAEFYLPEGTWTNYLTGERKVGGKFVRENHDYFSIPLYQKENTIVASGCGDNGAVYDYADGVLYKVGYLTDGGQASTVVYNGACEKESEIQVTREGNTVIIRVQAEKPCKVLLTGEVAVSVTGAQWTQEEQGIMIVPGKDEVVVTL